MFVCCADRLQHPMYEQQQSIKQEPKSPLQNIQNDGTFTTPTHRYTPSPNHQFNIPVLPMQGGEITLFTDNNNQQMTVPPLLTTFERSPIISDMSFQPTINNQFNLNLTNPTVVQGSLACPIPVNNFDIPPDGPNITAVNNNDINNVETFNDNFSSRLLDLDNQQSVDLNLDFSLSMLGSASLTNILGDTNNVDGNIDDNMSDSLRNMSLEKQ